MHIHITSDNGHVLFGEYGISWGNTLSDLGLSGYFCLNAGRHSIEFGDIDQGKPGVYLVTFKDDEVEESKALWQAK
jgi:hypothetical protein